MSKKGKCHGGKVQWGFAREDPNTCSGCGVEVSPLDYGTDNKVRPHQWVEEGKVVRRMAFDKEARTEGP